MSVEFYKESLPAWVRNNPKLLEAWMAGVGEVGGENALEYVQATPEYDLVFAGNRRDDGSLRHSEDEYLSIIESYARDLRSIGLNPDVFEDKFATLIAGEVSPREFWQERVEPMYDRIMARSDELLERYAADYGIDLTPEALLASALDPEIGAKVLNRQISLTELKAESDIALGTETTDRYSMLIEDMLEFGVDQNTSRALFQEAKTLLPALSVLASRHADQDDQFDLDEFVSAEVYNDPEQRRRMRRLVAQESSTFTGGAGLDFATTREGGVAGLMDR